MIAVDGFPKNKDKFIKLIDFFKEVLNICDKLNIPPVIDGSLAVFAYTNNQDMEINDIDLSVSEMEFPIIIKELEKRGISYKLREWHVLEVIKDDLKIGFGSSEYWAKGLPIDYETLQIDNYRVKMLSLTGLIELYRRAMDDRAKRINENINEKIKYMWLKDKYELLIKL